MTKSWRRIVGNACKFPIPEADPVPILSHKTESEPERPKVTDWREFFHTKDEMDNAPPISFLIDGFLQTEGVTAIAAPVRERKTIIALNMVHSLLTGEALFGKFAVTKKPERVLYIVPELFIGPFTDRLRTLGLMDFVGKSLFCRTGSKDGDFTLTDPVLFEALPGAVVFLDTAIRFLDGDENSAQDVRKFADVLFKLIRAGAESVVMLHHTRKEQGDSMTLETAMRGSGDMGAFLVSCWGTRLQDPAHPYQSESFLSNLKQRDFQSEDFEATCNEKGLMTLVESKCAPVLKTRRGNNANKDGKDDAALALLKAHPKASVRETVELLKEAGIKRGRSWIQERRAGIVQESGGSLP